MASGIEEIENSLDELPSSAVLVNTEEEVGPLADALDDALTDQNISVEPCINDLDHDQDEPHLVYRGQFGLSYAANLLISSAA